jgi:hypothetical protein
MGTGKRTGAFLEDEKVASPEAGFSRARAWEAMIKEADLMATILRPWYVHGPGHRSGATVN